MNFLAHQYLSFNIETVMVGNFIADTVSGAISEKLMPGVKLGISIHRSIDVFTDSHTVVLESRKLLYPYFGKYAAVVQDVYYDHFLAVNWLSYSSVPLPDFVERVYAVLNKHRDQMNAKALRILYYMELHNWLLNYATREGIDRALKGLSRRATFESNMENGIPALLQNYDLLNEHFNLFFPELIQEVESKFKDNVALLA